ncbi:MAG: type II toxin-antitoxin system RelE family toxin [Pseudonocardiaceae bacterium]
MARYRIRYVSYADEQLNQLPRELRPAFDARVEDLKNDPYVVGDYDERTGSYSTTFPEMGIILYVVSDKIGTVTIIRVNWVK